MTTKDKSLLLQELVSGGALEYEIYERVVCGGALSKEAG